MKTAVNCVHEYKNSLFVDYDTPHTFFRIPPLTLQPIVDYAVKHGRNLYMGPLHVSIRTQKTNSFARTGLSPYNIMEEEKVKMFDL